jgi:hypothetical protein
LHDIPESNWYCTECETESESSEEENDSADHEIDNEAEMLTGTRMRTRLQQRQQQPQISRTMQSERIRNAILARRSLRGALEAIGERVISRINAQPARVVSPRKRRTKRRRRRVNKVVIEYEITNGVKFPIKTRKIVKKKRESRCNEKKGQSFHWKDWLFIGSIFQKFKSKRLRFATRKIFSWTREF